MRVNFQQANKNLYSTSRNGLVRIENLGDPYRLAGIIKPIDPEVRLTAVLATAPGINLQQNEFIAYRLFYGSLDSHGNLYLSEPSNIVQQKSTVAGTNRFVVNIKVRVVSGLTTRHFYRLYRTKPVAPGVDPGDEMYLAYQKNFTPDDLINGFASVIDFTDPLLLGQPAYTNATSEGIARANARPPLAVAIAWYRNHLFYFNTKRQQTLSFRVIGSDFIPGQSITIDGQVYTVVNTAATEITNVQEGVAPGGEDFVARNFVSYTAVTGISLKIEGLARSLCRVINGNPANKTIYAYYSSAAGGVPGNITLIERGIGGNAFAISANNDPIRFNFEPVLKFLPTDADILSTNRAIQNGGHISKPNEPEHVPPDFTNFYVGDDANKILMAHVVRDGIILIRRRGVAVCTGNSLDDFSFREIDTTINFDGVSQASHVLNNKVYAFSVQGALEITINGINFISNQEDSNLNIPLINVSFSDNDNNGFTAIGYEERKQFIMTIADSELYYQDSSQENLTGPRNIFATYCYDYSAETWTRWLINANCFTVNDNLLYYGLNSDFFAIHGKTSKRVLRQRINNDNTDIYFPFFDDMGTATITNVNSTTNVITMNDATVNYDCPDISSYLAKFRNYKRIVGTGGPTRLSTGMLIKKTGDATRFLVIQDFNTVPQTYKLNRVDGLVNGDTIRFYRPIFYYVGKGPFYGSSPQNIKQYNTLSVVGDMSNAYQYTVEFFNENDDKAYPDMYPYHYNLLSSDFKETVQSKTQLIMEPLTKSQIQLDPYVIRQRFFERSLRVGVPPLKCNGNTMYVGISNAFAGSYFNVKSVGFEMTEVDSLKT